MKKILTSVILLTITVLGALGQKLITADEAVQVALKNNYGILVARNDARTDSINNAPGNAGMLPSIAISGSNNYAMNNVHQELSDGTEVNNPNSRSNSLNAGVFLNWTLFDGGKMFITKNKLNEMQALGELQFKDNVQQTIYSVILAYFNVVKQNQQLLFIRKVIEYNQERVKILQTSFAAGLTPKTNLLQAKIDLNVFTENAITQQSTILTAKRNLNQLLCRSIDSTAFDVIDSIPNNYIPNKEELAQKIYTTNITILAQQKQLDIARLTIKELQTGRYPKLNLSAGYNFLQTDNNSSTVLTNRAIGPQIGGSITIPLFQAGNTTRQIKTARLYLESTNYLFENTKLQVNTELQNTLTDFENQQSLLNIEKENSELARENLEISMQRMRLGQTTSLEVHLAQESYEDSMTRLLNFQYNLKIAETKLKLLLSQL